MGASLPDEPLQLPPLNVKEQQYFIYICVCMIYIHFKLTGGLSFMNKYMRYLPNRSIYFVKFFKLCFWDFFFVFVVYLLIYFYF